MPWYLDHIAEFCVAELEESQATIASHRRDTERLRTKTNNLDDSHEKIESANSDLAVKVKCLETGGDFQDSNRSLRAGLYGTTA